MLSICSQLNNRQGCFSISLNKCQWAGMKESSWFKFFDNWFHVLNQYYFRYRIILTLQKHLNKKRTRVNSSLMLFAGYIRWYWMSVVHERITHMHEEFVEGKTRYLFFSEKWQIKNFSLLLSHVSQTRSSIFLQNSSHNKILLFWFCILHFFCRR